MARFAMILMLGLFSWSACNKGAEINLIKADSATILEQIASHAGNQAVLVNFWATWCMPCVEEFPYIAELSREYAGQGLVTYFVSVDRPDNEDGIVEFLKKQGVSGRAYLKVEADQKFIDAFSDQWGGVIPFTLFYTKSTGAISASWEGKAPADKFEQAIISALEN